MGEQLRSWNVAVTEFRAGVIIGKGSVSYDLVRYLTERVPVLISPKWVSTLTQPIAIDDVLRYLVESLEKPETENRVLEIGGRDVLSYGQMMLGYAKVRGLRRWLVPVPVLTPRLSSWWVRLVTPLPLSVAQPLIDGLKNQVIVEDPTARHIFNFKPMGYEEAVRLALKPARSQQQKIHKVNASKERIAEAAICCTPFFLAHISKCVLIKMSTVRHSDHELRREGHFFIYVCVSNLRCIPPSDI